MEITVKKLGIISKEKKDNQKIIKKLLNKHFIYGFNYIESINIEEALKVNENVEEKIENKNQEILNWDIELQGALKDFVSDIFDFHKFTTDIVITPDGNYYAGKSSVDNEWLKSYSNNFLEKYKDYYINIYTVDVAINDEGELLAYTSNISNDICFEPHMKTRFSDCTLVEEEPIFLIEHTGGGWSTLQETFIITKSGIVYKNMDYEYIYVDGKTIDEIKQNMDEAFVKFIRKINETELKNLLAKVPDVKTDSDYYCTGAGMDGGEIAYYVVNKDISEKPVLVGIRYDRSIHSKNESEEFIANWLSKNIYGREI